MTRLFADGEPVQGEVNSAGDLVAFTWNRRRHRLTLILQTWEVDCDWWDSERGPMHGRAITPKAQQSPRSVLPRKPSESSPRPKRREGVP